LIECVPNVSEGRNPAIIARIADVITSTGCYLLDVHSDPDHNRSVYTIVGDCDQVVDGAVALAQSATALIDLTRHHGVHPRIGSIDVIPFIPLGTTPMSACVDVAHRVGRILGERFELPVLLYGAAAQSEQRASLPWIRRGGLQTLAQKLEKDAPDFGPRQPHLTAGAVAIGARPFLVAYNVVLSTSDVSIARAIASTLREANGGLPGVKALGLALDSRGLTQVSMNLTRVPRHEADKAATSLPAAFHAVEHEAKRLGVAILESEIVGLIPQKALADATAADLRLRDDPLDRILELRIAEFSS
jgi:glutamate formiminotransferase / 5-formyltetrahydrofolate cyclo-ligase